MNRKGYWIALIDVADQERYKEYAAMVGAILAKYGARFLVRGGTSQVVEGVGRTRIVIIEFPDYVSAVECYSSPEYTKARALRNRASTGDVMIVEGYEGAQPLI